MTAPLSTALHTMSGEGHGSRSTDDHGYAMGALLVSLAVMSIMMSMALTVWGQAAKREREAELIFRGEQYARAVELYQRRYAGGFPPDLESLVEQRFLRRLYRDPMTDDGEFQILYQADATEVTGDSVVAPLPGQATGRTVPLGTQPGSRPTSGRARGGVIGVISKSSEESLRIYNGSSTYDQWAFVTTPSSTQAGAGAAAGLGEDVRSPAPGLGQPTSDPSL